MKSIMFGINITIVVMSGVMMVLFVIGHILGGESKIDQFDAFLISMAICVYSGFNAKSIINKD